MRGLSVAVMMAGCVAVGCGGGKGAGAGGGTDSGAAGRGGGGGGGASDGGMAGSDAAAAGDAGPLSTAPGVWTWVTLPGTTCGDGSPAGIGINLAASADLLIYFEGGGACWSASTCFTLRTAIQIDVPYDATSFAADQATTSEIFSRTATDNPFSAATFVYVPYCTGDVHAGTVARAYDVGGGQTRTVHHTGGTNAQVIVDTLHATLPAVTRIWVTGSSAGGYGATLNHHRFVAAWPAAQVEILQDSAPFVDVVSNYAVWQQTWSLAFPPGCDRCTTSFPAVIDAVSAANPQSRIGLLTYTEDAIIKSYFGYGGSLAPALDSLLTNQFSHPTTQAFVLAGTSHTMLGNYTTLAAPNGTTLKTWIRQWAVGDAAWTTAR